MLLSSSEPIQDTKRRLSTAGYEKRMYSTDNLFFCDVILTRLTRLLLDFLTTLTGKLGFIIHFAQ